MCAVMCKGLLRITYIEVVSRMLAALPLTVRQALMCLGVRRTPCVSLETEESRWLKANKSKVITAQNSCETPSVLLLAR